MAATAKTHRQRVPAEERRDALIAAAIEEFAQTGYHGTPVDRIARRVGVAQPYVFTLFGTKRELFIAAMERGFEIVGQLFTAAASEYGAAHPGIDCGGNEILGAMASAYVDLLDTDRTVLMMQLQAYAACDDEVIRQHARASYGALMDMVQTRSGADLDQLHDFMSYGMYLSVQSAMGRTDELEALRDERKASIKRHQAQA